jgi:hypothetical protein
VKAPDPKTGMERYRIVEPDDFELIVGESSGDIRLTGTLTGETQRLPKFWRMESAAEVGAAASAS